jgi:hypothetical protein
MRKASALVAAALAVVALASVATAGPISLEGAPARKNAGGRHRAPAVASYRFDNRTTSAMGGYTRTWGVSWVDFSSDGDPDLFIGRHWAQPLFLVNDSRGFRNYQGDVDWEPGPKQTDRHACAWGEANKDGKPDLYCVQGADRGQGRGPNRLYIQVRNGFVERAHQFNVLDPVGRGRTVNWIDYDTDGDLDLFIGNAERAGTPNVMFRHGPLHFRRAHVGLGLELSTVGSSWSDWDRDGDPDLLVEQHHPGVTLAFENRHHHFHQVGLKGITGQTWLAGTWGDYNGDGWSDVVMVGNNRAVVFRNRHGHFRRAGHFHLRHGRMATWLDVENDGDLDLFVVQGAKGNHPTDESENRSDLLLVRRGGQFRRFARHSFAGPIDGNGDAVAAADYDRDGRVDLLVTNGYFHFRGPNELLRNISRSRHWAGLQLEGRNNNPMGFGAIVRVKAGRMVYKREITDNFSFRSQSEVGYLPLGLGPHRTARIRVSWPKGRPDCLTIAEGSITSVQQGRSRC